MEGLEAKAVGVHIDRVTQLQDSVDEVTTFNAENSDDFSQRTQEIATDICRQAKKIDTLAESLPGTTNTNGEQEKDFQELNRENEQATVELQEANQQARELLDSLSAMLTAIADNFGSSAT
ncbi:hypothetical protein GGH96_003365 [Coemansia sp. RSA 1972]|nr:hypothetical protein GGH96_003365 [Coemansia sp. RSA 1972]